MASASIQIGVEMVGAGSYASASERVIRDNENMAKSAEMKANRAIKAAERQAAIMTKSKRQIDLDSAKGATPEAISKINSAHDTIDAATAAQKKITDAVENEKQKQIQISLRAKETAVKLAENEKQKQLSIHKSTLNEKQKADENYAHTSSYSQTINKDSAMFGITSKTLLKGFVGFSAVKIGLQSITEVLSAMTSKKQIDAMQVYSNVMIGFVKSLPGGEQITLLAEAIKGGESIAQIEASTAALENKTKVLAQYGKVAEQINQARKNTSLDSVDLRIENRRLHKEDVKNSLVAGGYSAQVAEAMATAQIQKELQLQTLQEKRLSIDNRLNDAAKSYDTFMAEIASKSAGLNEDQAQHSLGRIDQLVSELIQAQRISDVQTNHAKNELDYTEKTNVLRKTMMDAQLYYEKNKKDQDLRLKNIEDAKMAEDLMGSYRDQLKTEKQITAEREKQAHLTKAQIAEAAAIRQKLQDKQLQEEATALATRAINFSNVESLSTAVGGVKVAGMSDNSIAGMKPSVALIAAAVLAIKANTTKVNLP